MKRPTCLIAVVVMYLALALDRPALAGQRAKSASPDTRTRTPESAQTGTQPGAKTIAYAPRDVARIKTKLRYTTLIILPKEEAILDFVCGDKELWVIDGDQNFAYVKPAKENSQTNLNLITASGNVYSFVLVEVSGKPNETADLKVFVEPRETAIAAAASAPRRFVSAQELEEAQRQAQAAKDEARQTKERAQTEVEQGVKRVLKNFRFAYRFEANRKPFYVRAIYRDELRTYIEARPEETPTIVELKDGKPNAVNFTYEDGVYITDRILDSGYLTVGKKRLKFFREE
jgi:type IV secretion system protein VirB9